jgi:hypothetical protein
VRAPGQWVGVGQCAVAVVVTAGGGGGVREERGK